MYINYIYIYIYIYTYIHRDCERKSETEIDIYQPDGQMGIDQPDG